MDYSQAMKEVLKIMREKNVLKVANISPSLKAPLIAQLDEKLKAIEAQVNGVSKK